MCRLLRNTVDTFVREMDPASMMVARTVTALLGADGTRRR